MSSIFNVFGPSPIKPIEQHIHKVYICAKYLHPFFDAVLKQDWSAAIDIQQLIIALEKEADVIKRNLRLHLPSGLFLPVARTDLLELLSCQDKIANTSEDIANLIISRRTVIPALLAAPLMELLTRCIDATKQACKAINELDQLLESGFQGSEVSIVEDMIVTLDHIEQDSDSKLAAIRHSIFELEKELPTIEVIFLYKLVQWIGNLSDHAQSVGGRLQILIAR